MTERQFLAFDKLLDSVFNRLQAGEITRYDAETEINDAVADFLGYQAGSAESPKTRRPVRKTTGGKKP